MSDLLINRTSMQGKVAKQYEYLSTAMEQMDDIVSPRDLVIDVEKLGAWHSQQPVEVVGRYAIGSWLAHKINERFSDQPERVAQTLTVPWGADWLDHRPGTGIALINLWSRLRWFSRERAQEILPRVASSDHSRTDFHRNLARRGVWLQSKFTARDVGDTDIDSYIRNYDRLQAAYVARTAMKDLNIAPLPPEENTFRDVMQFFMQLNAVILPVENPERKENIQEWQKVADSEELAEAIEEDISSGRVMAEAFDPKRLTLLFDLFDTIAARFEEKKVELYRSKPGRVGGEPYYVAVVSLEHGNKLAIAETPIRNNATYLVNEAETPGDWQEVLTLAKSEARELGALRLFHAPDDPEYTRHFQRAMNWVQQNSSKNS